MQPSTPSPEFVVRLDTVRRRRTVQVVLVGFAVLVVALLLAIRAFAALDGTAPMVFTIVWMVLLAVVVALIGLVCFMWGTNDPITQPWRISADGVRAQTPVGAITLPWHAIAAVTVTGAGPGARIAIAIAPDARPGVAGVDGQTRTWRHVLTTGLYLGGPTVEPGVAEIATAIEEHSGGRIVVR